MAVQTVALRAHGKADQTAGYSAACSVSWRVYWMADSTADWSVQQMDVGTDCYWAGSLVDLMEPKMDFHSDAMLVV